MGAGAGAGRAVVAHTRGTWPHLLHGLAWLATYVEALRQLASYAERMQAAGQFGEVEDLIVGIGFGGSGLRGARKIGGRSREVSHKRIEFAARSGAVRGKA